MARGAKSVFTTSIMLGETLVRPAMHRLTSNCGGLVHRPLEPLDQPLPVRAGSQHIAEMNFHRRHRFIEPSIGGVPLQPNDRWSIDFVADTFGASRRLRILAINNDGCRENLCLLGDSNSYGARLLRSWTRWRGCMANRLASSAMTGRSFRAGQS